MSFDHTERRKTFLVRRILEIEARMSGHLPEHKNDPLSTGRFANMAQAQREMLEELRDTHAKSLKRNN